MHHLVSYDIADNKRRQRAAKILDDYGKRVQKSVFELAGVDPRQFEICLKRLEKDIKLEKGDSIRIYFLCEACRGKVQVIGDGPQAMEVPEVFVV